MNVKVCQYLLPYSKSVKKMNQDLNVRSTILKLHFWKKKFLTYQWVEARISGKDPNSTGNNAKIY